MIRGSLQLVCPRYLAGEPRGRVGLGGQSGRGISRGGVIACLSN